MTFSDLCVATDRVYAAGVSNGVSQQTSQGTK